jgi:hypothetical protein
MLSSKAGMLQQEEAGRVLRHSSRASSRCALALRPSAAVSGGGRQRTRVAKQGADEAPEVVRVHVATPRSVPQDGVVPGGILQKVRGREQGGWG